jgi:hypothetical protein
LQPLVAPGPRSSLVDAAKGSSSRSRWSTKKRAKSVSIDLEDRGFTPEHGHLEVITKFKNNIGLTGVAGILKSMAGYQNGPADYVMNQIALQSNGDAGLKRIMALYREQLAQILAGKDGPRQASRLRAAAKALGSVDDVQLHSRLEIRDEDDEGAITDELEIVHRMHKFTAVIDNGTGQMLRRDFPLVSLANDNLSARRRVFGGMRLKLRDTATMVVDDAARVSISPHYDEPTDRRRDHGSGPL